MDIGVARFGGAYPGDPESRMKMNIGIFARLLNFDQLNPVIQVCARIASDEPAFA
jgi:hypothetical protein